MSNEKVFKAIPSSEVVCVEQRMLSGNTYYITQSQTSSIFYLYKPTPEGYIRLSKASSPHQFKPLIK